MFIKSPKTRVWRVLTFCERDGPTHIKGHYKPRENAKKCQKRQKLSKKREKNGINPEIGHMVYGKCHIMSKNGEIIGKNRWKIKTFL